MAELKIKMIALAIGELSKDSFTSSGKPEVSALEASTGLPVTADERDKAWAYFQAQPAEAVKLAAQKKASEILTIQDVLDRKKATPA